MHDHPGPMMVSIGDSVPKETWDRINLRVAFGIYSRIRPTVEESIRGIGRAFSSMAKVFQSFDFTKASAQLAAIPQSVREYDDIPGVSHVEA